MQIEFTPSQYRELVTLLFLGMSVNGLAEKVPEKMIELSQYVFSFYRDFDLQQLFVEEDGMLYINGDEREELLGRIDEYNEENFWKDLTLQLIHRDLVDEYGEERVNDMGIDEMMHMITPFVARYASEFKENGIRNLVLRGA